ncbi:MAG TPA: acyl-CoA thioesterase domain-containing protein [Ramlibacter sp.]|uniref:acyl-CoA thioesterase n=1 Tax=Ramlibacter sp. TaxID=1917967 RepID=UPI002D1A6AD5|nr:acyl-CoA thioesterase domain-containing protein [Ramlibacter sp.]HVZ44193.1 acyl-CoA thioesterase domain-containing protein [Ramlibacter sp.]
MQERWNGLDLGVILALDSIGPAHWRTRHGDPNMNGRSYGGQLLGQAMMAALMDMPDDRRPTMMQFVFLQGAMPEERIDLRVHDLQAGKRFTSRRVDGSQANGRRVLDAQVTFAKRLDAPEHGAARAHLREEQPESFATLDDVPEHVLEEITRLGGYSRDRKPSIEFRIPQAKRQLDPARMTDTFRFWMRTARPVGPDPRVQAAAFAYLSDWWLNFSSLGMHLRDVGSRGLYIASLNHALWLHRPVRADEWMHVESVSPVAAHGRGFAIASVHDLAGRRIATATQECLMGFVD